MEDDSIEAFAKAFEDSANLEEDAPEAEVPEEGEEEAEAETDVEAVEEDTAESDNAEEQEGDEEDAPEEEGEDDPYAAFLEDGDDASADDGNTASEQHDVLAENDALRQQNAQLIAHLRGALDLHVPNEDLIDPDKDGYDPDEFNRQQVAYRRRQEELLGYEQQQIEAQRAQMEEYRKARDAELGQILPDYFDKDRGPKMQSAMRKALVEAGEPAEVLDSLSPKIVKILDEALRYRAGQNALAKAKTAKKASKVVSKSSRKAPNRVTEANEKLAKEGTREAFADAFMAGMET